MVLCDYLVYLFSDKSKKLYLADDWLSYIVGSTQCGERHLVVLCDNLVYLFQTSPRSYIWLVIGCPILLVVHGVVSAISRFFVIT